MILAYIHGARPALARAGIQLGLAEDTLAALKALLACTAAGLALAEAFRRLRGRPVSPRLVAWIAGVLAALGAAGYLASDTVNAENYAHLWEFFHYYVGSKYHAELGYGRLYVCTAVAQSEVGPAARAAQKKETIRDLDNEGEMPVSQALKRAAECHARFTKARWRAFRADVDWFRTHTEPGYWASMQRDHGYNPPPLWTAYGGAIASLVPLSNRNLDILASLDILLLCAVFLAIWYAFGWRVMSLALIGFGTQIPSAATFTGGAFLRQDWLFLTVLAVVLARRHRPAASGAALSAATLLRIFPLLLFAGPAVGAIVHLVRRRRPKREHLRFFVGAAVAGVVLIGAGSLRTGFKDYPRFVRHIRRHGAVPLTNNMGLRVLVARLDDLGGLGFWNRQPIIALHPLLPLLPRRPILSLQPAHGLPIKALRPVPPRALAPTSSAPHVLRPLQRLIVPSTAPPRRAPLIRLRSLRLPRGSVMRWPHAVPVHLTKATAAQGPGPLLGRPIFGTGRVWLLALALLFVVAFAMAAGRVRTLWLAQVLGLVLVVALLEITCYYYSIFILAALATRVDRRLEWKLLAASALSAWVLVWPRLSATMTDRYATQTALFAALALALLLPFALRPFRRRRSAATGY